MAGLLYKDFAEIKGKKLSLILLLLTVAFMVLRVAFPGSDNIADLMIEDNESSPVNLIDDFFILAVGFQMFYLNYIINYSVSRICTADEKNKIRGYLFSCPLKKNTYIASKYIFIGIMTYVCFSLYMIWSVSCGAYILTDSVKSIDFLNVFNAFAAPFFSLSLLIAGIELPMFLLFGRDRAMFIKIGFIMFLAMLVIGYILFGDLSIFEKIDFERIIAWADAHAFELMLVNILLPLITVLLYYGSYRLTVAFYERKEREYD
ncbi:MAG: ABC-2 transporter permease [Lachnospiraceae bacterium]|nr:ABC-2 transporter permease [Lachnospiraceae bacterium]